jgi:branched-chain amino acid transport system ATP-binding protein
VKMGIAPTLGVKDVEAIYDRTVLALRGVSLEVPEGTVVALLGANGAGKTTTLKAISNLIRAELGAVTRGHILYRGADITHADPADLVREGLVQVLEGRHCFAHLTVEENLVMGALSRRPSRAALSEELERTYALFPRLRDRRSTKAGYTSGGEQQMVAIGRALMARPKLVLLDEPSMGLAPQVVDEIFATVRALNRREGTTFLIAEQNAAVALAHADHGYVVENGRVAAEGTAAELLGRDDVKSFYLGGGAGAAAQGAGRKRPRRPEHTLDV